MRGLRGAQVGRAASAMTDPELPKLSTRGSTIMLKQIRLFDLAVGVLTIALVSASQAAGQASPKFHKIRGGIIRGM